MFVQKKTENLASLVGKMRKAVLCFVGKGGSSTLEEHMAEGPHAD